MVGASPMVRPTKNRAVATASAVMASGATAHVAAIVRTGSPLRASSTWCSVVPVAEGQDRRLIAEAQSAASVTSHTPIARRGSNGCSRPMRQS